MSSFFDSRNPEQRQEDDFKRIIELLEQILELLSEHFTESNRT